MTLDEAIKHAEEVAERQEKYCPTPEGVVDNHKKCAEEHRQLAEWLTDYKRLLEQEPCEDAISRKAAIEKIHWLGLDNDTAIKCDLAIRALPSVNPQEPKTGHWEWEQYYYYPNRGNWHCSECKCVVTECVDKNEKGGIPLYKYCPQCGTKIIEPQESEEV